MKGYLKKNINNFAFYDSLLSNKLKWGQFLGKKLELKIP